MITLQHLSKKFNNTSVVNDINLSIKPGEIIGLLGPNGAGKTTTIRMITGVLPPTTGKVTIDGQNYQEHEHLLKQRIGYLPENNPLYEEMTVEEHLKFWSQMKGISPAAQADAINFAVKRTGIQDVYYRFIGELSKGYRQRVGLAQAILSRPDILILDEPTEGLDPNQRRDIQQLLSELKKSRTVIVSSHVLSEITHIASRVVIIHQGRVVGDDSPQNLVKKSADGQIIHIEVEGKEIQKKIKELHKSIKVTKLNSGEYQIENHSKKDIRSDIFNLAVKSKWTLLGMKQVERQLEDVFSELTQ